MGHWENFAKAHDLSFRLQSACEGITYSVAMYFADLTPCRYYGLSVGWLELGHPYPQGPVPSGFLERLLERCRHPEIRHRGAHFCEFCPSQAVAGAACVKDLADGERVNLLSGCIRVHPRQGLAFVAPTMVYHYIEAHRYMPPEAFIQAVMEDNPENAETAAARYHHGAKYLGWILSGRLRLTATRKARTQNREFRGSNHEH